MDKKVNIQEPVKPEGMELIFLYACPHCGRRVPLLAATAPAMAQCDSCTKHFPIVPVDEHSIRYLKLIFDNGRAAIDPDFA